MKPNRKSEQLVESRKSQQLQEIFVVLDSDKDGWVSARQIDISLLHPLLLEVITPLLIEMESKDHTLSQADFVKGGL